MDATATPIDIERGRRDGKKTVVTARRRDEVLHRDWINLNAAKDRATFAAAVVERIPLDDRPADVAEAARALEQRLIALADVPSGGGGTGPAAPLADESPEWARSEAESMLADPKLIGRVRKDLAVTGIAGEARLAATLYLVGTSRKLPRPLAAIVQGTSSAGKTHVIDRTAWLFPDDALIRATTMTTQALYHMPPGSLRNRWVVAGERSRREDDDTAEKSRALREMLSAGRLTKMMPVKMPGGAIQSVLIEKDGPIAYTESTTRDTVFDEDANRCLLLAVDETAG